MKTTIFALVITLFVAVFATTQIQAEPNELKSYTEMKEYIKQLQEKHGYTQAKPNEIADLPKYFSPQLYAGPQPPMLLSTNSVKKDTAICTKLAMDYKKEVVKSNHLSAGELPLVPRRSAWRNRVHKVIEATYHQTIALRKLTLMQAHNCKNLPTK